ncbi:MAG: adenylosuccinate lyase [Betaproteobacteria bacterium]|nr:adenylosuccinate lyase [Betaproteobacteria bacterium]
MTLDALSPLDGRYCAETAPLSFYFSERALIRERALVELAWLKTLAPLFSFSASLDLSPLAAAEKEIAENAESGMAEAVKAHEKTTRHDIKALEYFLHEELPRRGLGALKPLVHFACTSWDINNIALGRMISGALRAVMLPQLRPLAAAISGRAAAFADAPMLARTHGQPASPTTMGKEFSIFADRLSPRIANLEQWKPRGKMNGASGNYNAHYIARPDLDWQKISRKFVESHGMRFAPRTAQIEPYDDLADLFNCLRGINNILLDFCRDMWGYIALDYFCQKKIGEETGSSTMPHKINPIDFENSEGNIGVANALFSHFSDKLPVSRWQRDLSDSTVLRNIGAAFAHTLLSWRAAARGLERLTLNAPRMEADLDANWQVLTEAVQTVLRAENAGENAYEMLKDFSRGMAVGRPELHGFIETLPLGADAKKRLLSLSPRDYCGIAAPLAKQ